MRTGLQVHLGAEGVVGEGVEIDGPGDGQARVLWVAHAALPHYGRGGGRGRTGPAGACHPGLSCRSF